MKIILTRPVEYDAFFVACDMGPRYWEDATVNGEEEDNDNPKMPCKDGDRWRLLISITEGYVQNWPKGVSAEAFYKVCDDGLYTLLDAEGNPIMKVDSYVPEFLGGGDYCEIVIDKNGQIENWCPRSVADFFQEYDELY